MKTKSISMHQDNSASQTLMHRKRVDPETVRYFSEISNAFESGEVDLEELSFICCNALEETTGKELELATDSIISHTLQSLLEGCDVDHLCSFLRGCANDFPSIAIDKSGSHVAETALKSLAVHLQDNKTHSVIEETLTTICKVVIANLIDVMCNCYGSHVLRSLLCLCKGVPLDKLEFHSRKSCTVVAERLNLKSPPRHGLNSFRPHEFPELLKSLVMDMLKRTKRDITALQVNQHGSLVMQTALKLFAEYKEELLHIIPVVLGCSKENLTDGGFIEIAAVRKIKDLMNTTSFSHLMEVILEVAPETLYNGMFTMIFRNSLFEISSHHCGNFVVQALVSHANQGQIELIWEELGTRFKDLFGMGRSGVVASLIAASEKFHILERKCCQVVAAAVCSDNESPRCIVPRLLFLDSYFGCEDPTSWNWPKGSKIHVMGSLILQAIYKFPKELIHPYISSITSLEADHVLEVAKDAGGARVIEAFLGSNASEKRKQKLISRLPGHFGELAMHTSGSFTVEKCFTAGKPVLREAILSELVAVKTELSRTKQGPHLLRALDVDRFAACPEEWRSRQASKQAVHQKFQAVFGSGEGGMPWRKKAVGDKPFQTKTVAGLRKEIEHCVSGRGLLKAVLGDSQEMKERRGKKHGRDESKRRKKLRQEC